ncbi:hypothetical protein AURDEDRAFT_63293, partial [Auricularia subglabra TFB-10046 SS5]
DPDDEEVQEDVFGVQSYSKDWAPFPHKTMCFLIALDDMPRQRFSDSQMNFILWVMKEIGGRNVPTLRALRKFQEQLALQFGTRTLEQRSELGNVFYTNDIRATLAMDAANPQMANHFVVYPELCPARITNAWETKRWLELPLDFLTPMVRSGAQIYYVNELAMLDSGDFVLPYMWCTWGGTLSAMCRRCEFSLVSLCVSTQHALSLTQLQGHWAAPSNAKDSSLCQPLSADSHENFREHMPHPLRAKAQGDDVFTLFVNVWVDDVSGNVSKQWNKHWNVCYTNACIPGTLLNQEYFVRFFSTSQHASAAEQLAPLKAQILSTHDEPYPCFHAGLQRACRFRIVMQSLPTDNPQQSEHCSHTTGARANMYCRRCLNTRAQPDDEENLSEWYASHFKPGTPRSLDETRASVQRQLDLACQNLPRDVKAEQKSSGVKDPIASEWIDHILEKAKELTKATQRDPENPDLPHSPEELTNHLTKWLADQPGDHVSPLLVLSMIAGLDPHKHTPVEILHTVLLGLSKYIWHALYSSWKPEQEQLFATRLQSTDTSGLSIPPIRAQYMAQYHGALIGKHFKTLTQTMVFHLHDLCSPELFTLVKACGEFSSVLWIDTIEDMARHQADLRTLIDNVLDAYGDVDPLRILDKVKLHLLSHVPEDLVGFGPPVRSITEIFESFNTVFRLCSVLSNHLAPSRDIALTIADMDRLKHVISGGYWLDKNGIPTRASDNVMRLLEDYPILQRHLGWSALQKAVPGVFGVSWPGSAVLRCTLCRSCPTRRMGQDTVTWITGKHVVATSGDVCKIGAFVFFSDVSRSSLHVGRIMVIHCPYKRGSVSPFILVTEYTVANERHPEFGMPMLTRPQAGLKLLLPEHIHFIVNVQHDCRSSGCAPTGTQQVRQERIASTRTVPVIVHKNIERYVINTHAFHNAARLRAALPRHLTAPAPLKADRAAWHSTLAVRAHNASKRKKQQTKEKRKRAPAKRRRGTQQARARQHSLDSGEDDDEGAAGDSDDEYAPPPRKKHRRG